MKPSTLHQIRSVAASFLGLKYRELPDFGGDLREALEETLTELGARKCGENGTPAFELNNEYFRIGRRQIRVCTEDEMDVSLWGPKSLVDQVYARTMEKLKARRCAS